MQEPFSSENDVEDVLSSIRRLVAQGGRKGRATDDDSPPANEPAGKFVLTPDFRISEPTGESVESPAAPCSESSTSSPLPESEGAPTGESLPDRTRSSIAELEKTILELEAAIGEQNIEFEPDGSEDPAQEAATSVPLPRLRQLPEEEEGAAAETDEEGTPEMAQPEDRAPDFASARAPRQNEAANDAEDGMAPVADAHAETDTGTSADAALTLDEDALRSIIQEVLQEELRGELGLRITRNVRKLVRREIRRTLESLGIE